MRNDQSTGRRSQTRGSSGKLCRSPYANAVTTVDDGTAIIDISDSAK